jgi:peptidoglycan/xylan/chitin deacetylase (PgdA/CDA1 family)
VYSVGRRQVALTFDDGPAIPYTEQIVSILNRNEVPATFFIVGQSVSWDADSLRLAARSGHSLQVHAWDHKTFTLLSDYEIGRQITRTSAAVRSATGRRTSCYRPPGGSTSSRVRSAAAAVGHAPEILWNVNPSDYLRPAPSTITSHILSRANGAGLIVGLHDGGGSRSNTVAALPSVISGLKARGYEFVSLCN